MVQTLSILDVLEKETAVINCTYTNVASNYFLWYKKEGRKCLTLLAGIHSNVSRKKEGRYTVILDTNAKHVTLHITAVQAENSALYLGTPGTHKVLWRHLKPECKHKTGTAVTFFWKHLDYNGSL